jgi:hypothetical protein
VAREPRFTEHMNALLEPEQAEEIRHIAEKQKVSQGDVIRWLIRRGLIQFYRENSPPVA